MFLFAFWSGSHFHENYEPLQSFDFPPVGRFRQSG